MEALSKEELRSILAAARAESERDWLMILVSFWHGLRVSELLAIKGSSIKDGFLTVDRLKGSLRTVQALVEHPDSLFSERQALIDCASKTYPNQRLFDLRRQHVWRLMRKYGKLAGVPQHKAHPHALKHTIAMQMIEKAGIHKTRQRLGHKSIASTGAYLVESDAGVDAVILNVVGL